MFWKVFDQALVLPSSSSEQSSSLSYMTLPLFYQVLLPYYFLVYVAFDWFELETYLWWS